MICIVITHYLMLMDLLAMSLLEKNVSYTLLLLVDNVTICLQTKTASGFWQNPIRALAAKLMLMLFSFSGYYAALRYVHRGWAVQRSSRLSMCFGQGSIQSRQPSSVFCMPVVAKSLSDGFCDAKSCVVDLPCAGVSCANHAAAVIYKTWTIFLYHVLLPTVVPLLLLYSLSCFCECKKMKQPVWFGGTLDGLSLIRFLQNLCSCGAKLKKVGCLSPGSNCGPLVCETNVITNYTTQTRWQVLKLNLFNRHTG
jgi:hypothetical protein